MPFSKPWLGAMADQLYFFNVGQSAGSRSRRFAAEVAGNLAHLLEVPVFLEAPLTIDCESVSCRDRLGGATPCGNVSSAPAKPSAPVVAANDGG